MSIKVPFRQIHLDFHTSSQIARVGHKFNADDFADRFVEARVQSVTLFAKCHHGHLYYNTKSPARHPGLPKKLDLLGEQIEALHRRSIRTPIYISIQCDEFAGHTHPEWLAIKPDGAQYFGGPLTATWHILDMSSPYKDYMADQIAEVCRLFKPVDGLFLDMCWDQQSCSKWAIDSMIRRGLDPEIETDRAKHARAVALEYMARYKKLVEGFHGGKPVTIAFNSRPLDNLAEEKKYLRHVEIEALPTGGWGYTYFPINVRFVRPFGMPYLGMTARFHKSWADFGGYKPAAALKYECSQMLAHGARCSIGDQLHPVGTLDAAAYRLIGSVYRHVEACEPWCDGAKALTEIAVLRGATGDYFLKPGGQDEGAVRALQQLRHQFDFVPADGNLRPYKLVIVPELCRITAPIAAKLRAHVKAGGSLLVCGKATLDNDGKPALKELGVAAHGESPFTTTYFRWDRSVTGEDPTTDHVFYDRSVRLTSTKGTKVFAWIAEPYFERTWKHFSSHFQTPPEKLTRYAAAAQRGNVITLAYPVFSAFATHGNIPIRNLIEQSIERLLPDPLLRLDAPRHVEATVTKQRNRTIVHLLSYCPQRRAVNIDLVEEPTVLHDLPLSLRLPRRPRRVTLAPQGVGLSFDYLSGRASVKTPVTDGHQMIVFE